MQKPIIEVQQLAANIDVELAADEREKRDFAYDQPDIFGTFDNVDNSQFINNDDNDEIETKANFQIKPQAAAKSEDQEEVEAQNNVPKKTISRSFIYVYYISIYRK